MTESEMKFKRGLCAALWFMWVFFTLGLLCWILVVRYGYWLEIMCWVVLYIIQFHATLWWSSKKSYDIKQQWETDSRP